MQRHTDNVQDLLGNAIDGVTVTIRRVSDSGLASIFSDDLASPTPKANPFTNDVDGELFFYAANSRYNVILSGPVAETREDVILFDQEDTVLRGPVLPTAVGGLSTEGEVILVDVSGGPVTITLPATPGADLQIPDIVVQHHAGDITVNNITIARNGELIGGLAADVILNQTNQAARLIWGGTVLGWAIQNPKEGIDVGTIIGTSTDDPTVFGGTFDGTLEFQNSLFAVTATVGFDPAGDALRVFNKTRGGDIALRAISTTPAEIDIYFYEGSAGQHLWRDNSNNRLMELRAGFSSVTLIAQQNNPPDTGAAQVGQFRIEISNGGDPSATFGFPESVAASAMDIKSFVHGGPIRIVVENLAGGVERVLGVFDPDTGIILRNQNNVTVFTTDPNGISVSTAPATDVRIELQVDLVQRAQLVYDNSASILGLQNEIDSGLTQLRGRDSGSVQTVLFSGDPDGLAALYFDGEVQLETQATGARIRGELDNDPDVSNVQDVRFDMVNQSALLVGSVFFSVLGMSIQSEVFGGAVNIAARNNAGALGNLFSADPDGAANLFHQGILVVRTETAANGGLEANNTATGAGFERVLTTADLGGGAAASGISPFDILSAAAADPTLTLTEDVTLSFSLLHDVSSDIVILRNEIDSGEMQLRGFSSGSVDRLMLNADPDSGIVLYWQANQRIRAAQQGLEVIGQSAAGANIRFFGSNGTTLIGLLSFGASTHQIQGLVDGAAIQVTSLDAGGIARTLWRADPDNTMDIRHIGVIKLITRFDGIALRGDGTNNPATGGTQDFQIRFDNTSGVQIGEIEWPSSIDMRIVNRVHGGNLTLQGQDGAGAARTFIDCDPDDDVEIFDDGVGVIRTQQAGLGGAEVNNTLTGGGYERVATLTDLDNLSIFTQNIADDNVPDATFVTGVLTITLEANSIYAFEFFFEFQTPNASGDDFVLRFDNSATWAGTAMVTCDNDAGQEFFTQQLAGAPATSITVNSDTTSNTICKGTGVIMTDGSGGTFELDVAKSADAGGDGTFFAHSWMRVQKIGG